MILLLLIGMLASEGQAAKADQAVVLKSQRTLTLFSQGKLLRTYKVALGSSPAGAKEQEGDHKTPEGRYVLDRRNAKSRFYKSIHVSYTNEQDKTEASQRGVSPGGDIMIHGPSQRIRMAGRRSPSTGLDGRMYCRNECGDGRNMGPRGRRDSHRDPAIDLASGVGPGLRGLDGSDFQPVE
jgi:L,D-transpeptidase-like protein